MVTRLFLAVLWTGLHGLAGAGSAQTIQLQAVDSGLTSPSGNYRWLDVADQEYSAVYRTHYHYTQAVVVVHLCASPQPVQGTLWATNLKPNFAYQLKLVGRSGTAANERIGLAGRYWQEEWSGPGWANGQNLNDKGDGYFPTPNDETYFSRRDITDTNSPTGLRYQYTGYLVADYFLTDSNGNATVTFQVDSSYHVLWRLSQRSREANDGPLKAITFQASPAQPAYDTNYPQRTVSLFGEWERLPTGGIQLRPGEYACEVVLTEESFHGSGGEYAGGWAAAMAGNLSFQVTPRLTARVFDQGKFSFEIADCYPGTTNDVQRCYGLASTNGWQTVFTFVSAQSATNWSDSATGGNGEAFYRVTVRTGP